MRRSVWIGWDPREAAAFAVAKRSASRNLIAPVPVRGLVLSDLVESGLYRRPTERRVESGVARLYDLISDAPMSTEHACARFLVKELAGEGWALFMDGDVLVRGSLDRLFQGLDHAKALYCVQHDHQPTGSTKMDGQAQQPYPRKNWSSVMVLNCGHPANRALTPELVNTVPGRDLHRFCWLEDKDIGALSPEYNVLIGHSDGLDPAIAHFTDGVPDMPGYERQPYADEWRAELRAWIG